MDISEIYSAIRYFTLNQRSISYQFRKTNGLNKTDVEILTFANTTTCFNPYVVQKHFEQMNLQQVRLSIRKLAYRGAIEIVGTGKRGHAAIYMITAKGSALLADYNQYWLVNFNLANNS